VLQARESRKQYCPIASVSFCAGTPLRAIKTLKPAARRSPAIWPLGRIFGMGNCYNLCLPIAADADECVGRIAIGVDRFGFAH
jgi:hypothetical protein